ncbi:hypothetical protein JOM56_014987 [Amanita muscaria]
MRKMRKMVLRPIMMPLTSPPNPLKTKMSNPPTLEAAEADSTLPLFANSTSAATLFVYLDTARPLSEPKWAKTGDVQDWLKSMFGRMFWVAGDAAEGWEKEIQVVDPDPPPTIWTVLEGWSQNSPVGALNERQRFLKTHMTETDNLLEILLRLVRGERATPFSQSTPTVSAPSVSGPLLSALAHGAQQTPSSTCSLFLHSIPNFLPRPFFPSPEDQRTPSSWPTSVSRLSKDSEA